MKLVVRNASGQTSPSAWRHLRISGVFLRALPLHPQTESRPWRRRSSQWGHDLGHVTASQGDSAVERRWAPLSAVETPSPALQSPRTCRESLEWIHPGDGELQFFAAFASCWWLHSLSFFCVSEVMKIYVPSLSKSSNTSRTSTVLTIKRLVHSQIAGCHLPPEVGSQKSTDHPKSAPLDSDSTSARNNCHMMRGHIRCHMMLY